MLACPIVDLQNIIKRRVRLEVCLVGLHRLLNHLCILTLPERAAEGERRDGRAFGMPKKSNLPCRKSSLAISFAALSAQVIEPPCKASGLSGQKTLKLRVFPPAGLPRKPEGCKGISSRQAP